MITFFANALKGSLSTKEIYENKKYFPINFIPLSDGGDGFLDTILFAFPKAKLHFVQAQNALNITKKVPFLSIKNNNQKIAFIECAKICGLGEIPTPKRNVMKANSFGIGQVIKHLTKQKYQKIYIGLGGVAFNDAGIGMLKALNFNLLDKQNKEISLGILGIKNLIKIIPPKNLHLPEIICFSDVKNKLLGQNGSARIYGPQKGANKKQVLIIENSLKHLQKIIKKNINKTFYGASGALPVSLCGILDAKIKQGTKEIFTLLNINKHIKESDLIITSEGTLDKQTLFGKAPNEIIKLAKKYKKELIFICGENNLKQKQNFEIIELSKLAKNKEDSIKNANKYLKRVLFSLIKDSLSLAKKK